MEDNADEMIEMKCVIIGSNTVGKTSAIRAFSGHEFLNNNHYEETKDVVTTSIQLKGNDPIVKVTFWDCSPQTFLKSPHEILHDVSCIILAYDVSNYNSFLEATKSWMDLVKPNLQQDSKLFIMLLGCKTDLAANRTVSIKEAEAFASRNGVFFMEISAKNGTNVDLTLTLLRIRSVNALRSDPITSTSSSMFVDANDSMIPNAPSSIDIGQQKQEMQAFVPPPPPPSPPNSESNITTATAATRYIQNQQAVEDKLVDNLIAEGVRLKSPKRQFGLTAQISSSYESINAILGRQYQQQPQTDYTSSLAVTNAAANISKNASPTIKSPKKQQVYMNLHHGRRSQYNVDNNNTPNKVETKEGNGVKSPKQSVNQKSPVFEQEYEVLRGMFEEFDATTQQTLQNSSTSNNSFNNFKAANASFAKINDNNNSSSSVRVYTEKSPRKAGDFDNKFGRGMGPRLDSYDTIDSPIRARQATGISSSKSLRMPNSSTSPASIPLINASQKINIRDSGLGNGGAFSNNSNSRMVDKHRSNSSIAYGNILEKAYGQNLLNSYASMNNNNNNQGDGGRGRRWNDNNVMKVSPRKLKAKVIQQERNKQIKIWNQHVVKKKFGRDEEVKTKRKKKLGYLPKQYQRYRRPRPSLTEKPTTPPDLVVDVTLPNGRSGTIEVRAGDNARDLAEKYVYEHSLRMRFIPILTDLVEEKVKEFLILEERKLFAQKRRQARNGFLANQALERNVNSPGNLNNSSNSFNVGIPPSPNLTVPQPFYLETAERGRSTFKSPPKRIIAKLHIDVGPSKRGTITIRIGDNPEKLVNEFRRTYRIKKSQCVMILTRVTKLINDARRQEEIDRENEMNGSGYSKRDSAIGSFFDEGYGNNDNSNNISQAGNMMMGSPSYGNESPERALTPAQNDLFRRTLGFGANERAQSQVTRGVANRTRKSRGGGGGGTTTEHETEYTTDNGTTGAEYTTDNVTTTGAEYTTDNGTGDEDEEETDYDQKEEQQRKAVFNLDINLPGGQSKRITVYEGDDPKDLAKVFVEKNGLPNPESSINRLTQLLVSGLEKHPQSVA